MSGITIGDETFDSYTGKMEVTSLSRPDTSWRYVDREGHEHRWYSGGVPAEGYEPSKRYDVPTLETVEDEPIYVDGDEIPQFHRECRICRERITPGRCPDTSPQYIRGLSYFSINGASVTEHEFKARAEAAMKRAGISLPGDEAGHG